MKRNDLLSRLAETLQAPAVSFSESTRLASLAMWDSMGQLEVACLLDSAIGVRIPAGTFAKADTVGDLLEFAKHKLN
jgi:acyl carrier protein